MNYQNFDLEIISSQGDERLYARVLESPQGDCPFIDVKWPFAAEEENALLAEIYGGPRQRRAGSSKVPAIQDFGGRLFDAVFTGDIEHLFRSSLDVAIRAGKGLRIRLRLPEESDLHSRPWEFLFDTECREFITVRDRTPLVRYLPVAQPIPPIRVEGPLRLLVALSSPTDHPRLDIEREWDILCQALEPSITAGQIELSRVPGRCTFDNLRDSLRHFDTHIFHFVGHGMPGALVLEQESGKGLEMEAPQLRSAFPSGTLPRLIVLNACSGAIAEDVPFSGLAQGFLKQGVPAVVAMQASITDDAALIFTRYFYRDLVESGAVDASLTEARLRMQGNGHPIEWGTPVLYMRALSGQLFQPGASQNELKKPRESHTRERASPLKPEMAPNERKKPKETRTRQTAPPLQHGASQNERGKIRDIPTADMPLPDPEPRLNEAVDPSVTQARESPPPIPPAPKPNEPKKPRERQARMDLPLVRLEPHLEEQAIPPDFQKEEAPAPKRHDGKRPQYWLAAGLLAAVAGLSIGSYKYFSSKPVPPVPAPPPISKPTPPLPRPNASLLQTPSVKVEPSQGKPKPKPSRPVSKRAAPAAPNNCKNPDISERNADCLFPRQ